MSLTEAISIGFLKIGPRFVDTDKLEKHVVSDSFDPFSAQVGS